MACPLARQILKASARPDWWPPTAELRIVVAEGEIDTLICATQSSEYDECAPATLGVVSGSWTLELVGRVPEGAIVVIATDHDTQGDKYAAQIVASFSGRNVSLERWLPVVEESA